MSTADAARARGPADVNPPRRAGGVPDGQGTARIKGAPAERVQRSVEETCGTTLRPYLSSPPGNPRALNDTFLANASPNRIGPTLRKIGAVVIRKTRRIRLLMSTACPHQDLFSTVALRPNSSKLPEYAAPTR